MKPESIQKDTVVTLHYQLTLDDGSVADSSFAGEPLAYLHGHGNLVPGLERQLAGKHSGDKFETTVSAADGYGEFDPDAVHTVPRSSFPKEVDLQAGMGFHSEDDRGRAVPVFVQEVRGDEVVVSTNHPLAGQRLNFKIEILSLRAPSKEELRHGHVHGPGGHHH